MRVILRRHSPNALELAAANADDRHPYFIVKLRITLHLRQFNQREGVERRPGYASPYRRQTLASQGWFSRGSPAGR